MAALSADGDQKALYHETRREKDSKTIAKREARKKLAQKQKELARKVPVELLAREWLNEQKASTEMRCYLLEKLLPTLVISLEKLLTEVTLRDLAESKDEQPDFNPINFVGQYLMRNNPRYSNFPEAHPYCKSMKEVSTELKRMAYAVEGNKLAELKVKTRIRRVIREKQEAYQREEEERKATLLKTVYSKWLAPGEDSLPMTDVQLAVESWIEVMPESSAKAYSSSLLLFSKASQVWEESEFMSTFLEHGHELETDTFHQLVNQLEVCGTERRRNKLKEERRNKFISVFESCDPDKTNMVDRLRVLYLLACYYDSLPSDKQDTVRNPRQWPIMDVVEMEELEEDEEGSCIQFRSLSRQDLLDFFEGSLHTEDMGNEKRKSQESSVADVKDEEKSVSIDVKEEVEKERAMDEVDKVRELVKEESSKEEESGGNKEEGSEEGAKEEEKEEDSEEGTKEESGEGTKEQESEEGTKSGEGTKEEENKEKSEEGRKEESEEGTKEEESGEGRKEEESEGVRGKEGEPVKNEDTLEEGKDKRENNPLDSGKDEMVSKPSVSVPASSTLLKRRLTAGSSSRAHSLFRMRNVCGMSSQPIAPSGPGAVWDHEQLNPPQFVQLVELFVGAEPDKTLIDSISLYIKNNYTETEKERSEHIEHKQKQTLLLEKRKLVNQLFEIWDNDRSGYLELKEIQKVLSTWNNSGSVRISAEPLGEDWIKLSHSQFQSYMNQLTSEMNEKEFNVFITFLVTSIKLTFEEQHRGAERKLLLVNILKAGKTNTLDFIPAMKTAVQVIHQDVGRFGDGKAVSVIISLCEPPLPNSTISLCVKATSPAIEQRVVGYKLRRDCNEGVGFTAVDSAKLVHVVRIQKDDRVRYFLPEHKDSEYDGSLVVAPITTPKQDVVGTISVDSLGTGQGMAPRNHSFYNHEINFFQGVGLCLGEIYHCISVIQKLLKVSLSAMNWIYSRCSAVTMGEVYIVQPTEGGESSYDLCLMLSTAKMQSPNVNINKKLKRKKNLFKEYLFQCVENSEPLSVDAYGSHHLVYPIRDSSGCAVAMVDLTMASSCSLNPQQLREVIKVLKLLTTAFYQISSTSHKQGKPGENSEGEEGEEDSLAEYRCIIGVGSDMSTLFDQLMLADLRENFMSVDSKMFAELRSYMEPPECIFQIIRALLYILYPDQEFSTWLECKQRVTISLVKALKSYDPLQVKGHPRLALIKELTDLPVSSVYEHGSLPAKYIYRWVCVCVTLLEHSASMTATLLSKSTITTTHPEPSSSPTTIQAA